MKTKPLEVLAAVIKIANNGSRNENGTLTRRSRIQIKAAMAHLPKPNGKLLSTNDPKVEGRKIPSHDVEILTNNEWKILKTKSEESSAFSTDASGHKHDAKGQFTSKGNSETSKKGDRAKSVSSKLAFTREAYEKARDEHRAAREERRQVYDEVRREAESHKFDMKSAAEKMIEDMGNVGWDSDAEGHQPFTDLEHGLYELQGADTAVEIRDALSNAESYLVAATEANRTLIDNVDPDPDANWPSQQSDNEKRLAVIGEQLKAYKRNLRGYVGSRREMRAMRSGTALSLTPEILVATSWKDATAGAEKLTHIDGAFAVVGQIRTGAYPGKGWYPHTKGPRGGTRWIYTGAASAGTTAPAHSTTPASVPALVPPPAGKAGGSDLSDRLLKNLRGDQFANLQFHLGIKKPKMGKAGIEAVQAALNKRPGGGIIGAILGAESSAYTDDGLPSVLPGDTIRNLVDGKYTAEQLLDAAKWASSHEGVDGQRWIYVTLKTSKTVDGDIPDPDAFAYVQQAANLERLAQSKNASADMKPEILAQAQSSWEKALELVSKKKDAQAAGDAPAGETGRGKDQINDGHSRYQSIAGDPGSFTMQDVDEFGQWLNSQPADVVKGITEKAGYRPGPTRKENAAMLVSNLKGVKVSKIRTDAIGGPDKTTGKAEGEKGGEKDDKSGEMTKEQINNRLDELLAKDNPENKAREDLRRQETSFDFNHHIHNYHGPEGGFVVTETNYEKKKSIPVAGPFPTEQDAANAYHDLRDKHLRPYHDAVVGLAKEKEYLLKLADADNVPIDLSPTKEVQARFKDSIEQAKDTDKKFKGEGRYEAETWKKLREKYPDEPLPKLSKDGAGYVADLYDAEGKPVPPEILKDYPDLAPKPLSASVQTAKPEKKTPAQIAGEKLDAADYEHRSKGSDGGQFVKTAATKGRMMEAVRVGKGKEAKVVLKNSKGAPDHIKPGMVPPDWSDLEVSLDPEADVLVRAVDSKGRGKVVYNDKFPMRNAAIKYARVNEMINEGPKIDQQIQDARTDPKTRDAAECAWLMSVQATRPGSKSDTGARVKAYGATTLEGRHVTEDETGVVRLSFIGKEGVLHHHTIMDKELAKMLVERSNRAGANGRLFATTETKVNKFIDTLDGGHFSSKDFRTRRANLIAVEAMKKYPDKPKTEKEYKKRVKEVAEVVSGVLGNKPKQCLESYINPTVFSIWKVEDAK